MKDSDSTDEIFHTKSDNGKNNVGPYISVYFAGVHRAKRSRRYLRLQTQIKELEGETWPPVNKALDCRMG